MPDPLDQFSAEDVLRHLKGFQRDAAEYAFDRLFRAPDSTGRFLIADEVGLGKTVIAKGVLARALEHLRDQVPRIDVIYICSNLRIARQNINRLNPMRDHEFADAERITLLPIHLQNLASSRLNFIAFTPGTSLDLKGNLGVRRERLLLYALLRRHWTLRGVAPKNVLQGSVQNTARFRLRADSFEQDHPISPELAAAFHAQLDRAGAEAGQAGKPDLRSRFEALCQALPRQPHDLPIELRRERNSVVGELRGLLARACIGALEPDVVILDEFQRFRDLLSPDSEEGELARNLFEWQAGHARARVLLLSATPYKAFTLQHEKSGEDHYVDFLRTVSFLNNSKARSGEFETLLERYRQALYELRDDEGLRVLKGEIEAHLRKVMSRTERVAVAGEANGMLRSHFNANLTVTSPDLRAYRAVKQVADVLKVDDAVEYWKSAAYPVSFMEGYQLKHLLEEKSGSKRTDPGLLKAVQGLHAHSIPRDAIHAYQPVPLNNAPLRDLVANLEGEGAFEVLWLPPALPYYRLVGNFAGVSPKITKRLIFSAWNLVPRSLAALLSYEAERRAAVVDEPDASARSQANRPKSGLLRLSRSEGRLVGLPLLTLLYPCRTLAEACDPRQVSQQAGTGLPDPDAVLGWAEQQVAALLPQTVEFAAPGQAADESWYWLAPLMLDRAHHPAGTTAWWELPELDRQWAGQSAEDADLDGGDEGWREHVTEARRRVTDEPWPKTKAPADLVRTLALVGLAGPATCALRSLLGLIPARETDKHHRTAAAQIGWAFRALFNRPESMALVRKGRRTGYWEAVLEYGLHGCVAAVLDEYLHVLRDATGVTYQEPAKACAAIAATAMTALQIRTAALDVTEPVADPEARSLATEKWSMRCLFAMRFGSEKTDDQQQVQRDSAVGSAFNSPFWPFVLATTSVGQEGLDFHWYCHAVVHWNLPSNPVDLEQREGRVHRFKGHAVRKNVAQRFGPEALLSAEPDIWSEAFRRAAEQTPPGHRGLMPYWLYPLEDGAWIERHVSVYPLSRDEGRYHALQRSLGAYRMVFGQPRQDELLAYLVHELTPERLKQMTSLLRIDLSPPARE